MVPLVGNRRGLRPARPYKRGMSFPEVLLAVEFILKLRREEYALAPPKLLTDGTEEQQSSVAICLYLRFPCLVEYRAKEVLFGDAVKAINGAQICPHGHESIPQKILQLEALVLR